MSYPLDRRKGVVEHIVVPPHFDVKGSYRTVAITQKELEDRESEERKAKGIVPEVQIEPCGSNIGRVEKRRRV
jgi:hypothetical protein